MEPALDVMNRALQGDQGGRSFLEQTTSIYVLDVTDTANPKTYGCWNFIHQAMNEVERFEANQRRTGHSHSLVSHVRLLSTMALRVARRSSAKDRTLITTCISNASQYTASPSQLQWLIDLNLELREIVIGRIAATAFDFSFHRRDPYQYQQHLQSAFADPVVLDTFCAILSANAVAGGPRAIDGLASEWIIPSSRDLPPMAVASVVLHLAEEGMRKASPVGTKETLQKLSEAVFVVVLVPILSIDAAEGTDHIHSMHSLHQVCLKAMKFWCEATDLSLPQINHICTKANLNVISILSDIMYSDSDEVVDSLAEVIESVLHIEDEKIMTDGRMSQVRLLLQVDEATFRDTFSPEQLKMIETKEILSILDEFVSAIGLQRFRFVERQNKGEHGVCRNLVRIAASVCSTYLEAHLEESLASLESGALDLLMKGAAHPSLNICALVLPVLTRLVPRMPSLSTMLLPMLQRCAIVPHAVQEGFISFSSHEPNSGSITDFRVFRNSVLTDALSACWRANRAHYIDSCTSAVEEFCAEGSPLEVSLQLEAALFCIEIVSTESMDVAGDFLHKSELTRVQIALSRKTASLLSNPLVRARAARMLKSFLPCFVSEQKESVIVEIIHACALAFLSEDPTRVLSSELLDVHPKPVVDVALALEGIFSRCPKSFLDENSVATLKDTWIRFVSSFQDSRIPAEAVLAVGIGVVAVLRQLNGNMGDSIFYSVMTDPCLFQVGALARQQGDERKLGDTIRLLSGLLSTFGATPLHEVDKMQSGTTTSPDRPRKTPVPVSVISFIGKALPSILDVASVSLAHEHISTSLKQFFTDVVPLIPMSNDQGLLADLFSVVGSILGLSTDLSHRLDVSLNFLSISVCTFGCVVEDVAIKRFENPGFVSEHDPKGRMLEDLFRNTFTAAQNSLGRAWLYQAEQDQGQDPVESRPQQRETPGERPSTEALDTALDLMTKVLQECPFYALHIPSGLVVQQKDVKVLERAVVSAVEYLDGQEKALLQSSVRFLRTLVNQPSRHRLFESFVADSLGSLSSTAIGNLVAASCGSCDVTLLHDVAALLITLLSSASPGNVEEHVVTVLNSTSVFSLGENAKNVTLSVLGRCQRREISIVSFEKFLQDLWQLHQVEDVESLPMSDAVGFFLRRYAK